MKIEEVKMVANMLIDGKNKSELSPCPFCGNKRIDVKNNILGKNYLIHCPNCGASDMYDYEDRSEAIANWNRRREEEITNKQTGIKYCPFCGSYPIYWKSPKNYYNSYFFCITCPGCNHRVKSSNNMEIAIANWNERNK